MKSGQTIPGNRSPFRRDGKIPSIVTKTRGIIESGLTGVSPPEREATIGELVTGIATSNPSHIHQANFWISNCLFIKLTLRKLYEP
jgi:hypothetical protein